MTQLREIIANQIEGLLPRHVALAKADAVIEALTPELLAPAIRQALLDLPMDYLMDVDEDAIDVEGYISLVALAKRLIEVLNAEPVEAETDGEA